MRGLHHGNHHRLSDMSDHPLIRRVEESAQRAIEACDAVLAHLEQPTYRPISGELLANALMAGFGATGDAGYMPRVLCDDQDVPVELIELLAEHIEEADLVCDHSVGICCCNERAVHEDLTLWLASKQRCPACGGEGIGETREVRRSDPELGDWTDYETDPCARCDGKGVITIES